MDLGTRLLSGKTQVRILPTLPQFKEIFMFENITTVDYMILFGVAVVGMFAWRTTGGSWLKRRAAERAASSVNTSDEAYHERRVQQPTISPPSPAHRPARPVNRRTDVSRVDDGDDLLEDVLTAAVVADVLLDQNDGYRSEPEPVRREEPTPIFEPSRVEYEQAPSYESSDSGSSDSGGGSDD